MIRIIGDTEIGVKTRLKKFLCQIDKGVHVCIPYIEDIIIYSKKKEYIHIISSRYIEGRYDVLLNMIISLYTITHLFYCTSDPISSISMEIEESIYDIMRSCMNSNINYRDMIYDKITILLSKYGYKAHDIFLTIESPTLNNVSSIKDVEITQEDDSSENIIGIDNLRKSLLGIKE